MSSLSWSRDVLPRALPEPSGKDTSRYVGNIPERERGLDVGRSAVAEPTWETTRRTRLERFPAVSDTRRSGQAHDRGRYSPTGLGVRPRRCNGAACGHDFGLGCATAPFSLPGETRSEI